MDKGILPEMLTEGQYKALIWILSILNKTSSQYQITGGLAAKIYGSQRPLYDIDINIDEQQCPKILPFIDQYIFFGPEYYQDSFWRINLLTLNYYGQYIDLCGIKDCQIFDSYSKSWTPLICNLSDSTIIASGGMNLFVENKNTLINYKRMLLRDCDREDLTQMGQTINSSLTTD